jgi:ADP-heptose:LPS heptosyltransferase
VTVLLYRPRGLADFLTAVPAYRAVRRAFPDERVVLAAPAPFAPLVPLTGAVDRLAPATGLGIPRRVRGRITAVNLHGRGPESHRVLQSLGPERLIAFACPEADVDGPTWAEDEHDVVRWVRLLRESGIPADDTDLRLARPTELAPARGVTVVHPGGPSARHRWPEERFARLAAALSRRGHEVVVTGDARERPLAERVTHRAGLPPHRNLAGVLDVGALASLVHDASLVVCGDSAVGHLASAFATPSVVLFGARSPARGGPPRSRLHRALWRGDEVGARSPSGHGAVGSLLAIAVEEVLEAATEVLRAADDQRSAADLGPTAGAGFERAVTG